MLKRNRHVRCVTVLRRSWRGLVTARSLRCRRAAAKNSCAPSVVAGLAQAIADAPVPDRTTRNRTDLQPWLAEMSRRIARRMSPTSASAASSRDRALRSDSRGSRSAARAGRDPPRERLQEIRDLDRRRARLHAGDAVLGQADRRTRPEPVQPAHQPALRLRHPAPLSSTSKTATTTARSAATTAASARPEYPHGGDGARANRYSLDAPVARGHSGGRRCRRSVQRRAAAVTAYRGRFAPSPTGPLHFGSLVAALASYCDARAPGGEWLVRIEDVDEPRSRPGAEADDPRTRSDRYGFAWDGDDRAPVRAQRDRYAKRALARVARRRTRIRCACTRRELEAAPLGAGGRARLPGHLPRRHPADRRASSRTRVTVRVGDDDRIAFVDRLQGPQRQDLARDVGDFVVRRADGLYRLPARGRRRRCAARRNARSCAAPICSLRRRARSCCSDALGYADARRICTCRSRSTCRGRKAVEADARAYRCRDDPLPAHRSPRGASSTSEAAARDASSAAEFLARAQSRVVARHGCRRSRCCPRPSHRDAAAVGRVDRRIIAFRYRMPACRPNVAPGGVPAAP